MLWRFPILLQVRAVKGNETWAVGRVQYREEKFDEPAKLIALGKQAVTIAACSSRLLDCNPDKELLENKNALIYGGGRFIDGAVAVRSPGPSPSSPAGRSSAI
jgi:hypothetical protein